MNPVLDTLHITCRGMKLTQPIEDYVTKKLKFLDKFDKYIVKTEIVINDNKGESLNFQYEVTIWAKKKDIIRVEERGADLYALIDRVHDTLKLKIDKYKERITDKSAERDFIEEELPESEDDIQDTSYTPKITKRKVYSDNRPLHPSEAIDQMEMIGHISFLFKNIETNKYTMVYKRSDGNYGLVEPEEV